MRAKKWTRQEQDYRGGQSNVKRNREIICYVFCLTAQFLYIGGFKKNRGHKNL